MGGNNFSPLRLSLDLAAIAALLTYDRIFSDCARPDSAAAHDAAGYGAVAARPD